MYALTALIIGLIVAIIGLNWKASFWRSLAMLVLGITMSAAGGGVILARWVMSL